MTMLNKYKSIFLLLFFFTNCGKEPEIVVQTRCFPITQTVSTNSYTQERKYFYESDQLIRSETSFMSGSTIKNSSNIFTYNSRGNRIKSDGEDRYFIFTYNGSDQLIRSEMYFKPNNVLQERFDYEYNSSGQLIKQEYSYLMSSGLFSKSSYLNFEYDDIKTKNFRYIKRFDYSSNSFWPTFSEYEYDEKKKPFNNTKAFYQSRDFTENNVVKLFDRSTSATSTILVESSIYTYNEHGYPATISRTQQLGQGLSVTEITTYTYNCK